MTRLAKEDALRIYRSPDLLEIARRAHAERERRHGRKTWARLDLNDPPMTAMTLEQRVMEVLNLEMLNLGPAAQYEPPLEAGLSGFTYLKHVAVARLLLSQVDHIVVRHCPQVENVCQLALRFGADTLVGPNVAELERQIAAAGLELSS